MVVITSPASRDVVIQLDGHDAARLVPLCGIGFIGLSIQALGLGLPPRDDNRLHIRAMV